VVRGGEVLDKPYPRPLGPKRYAMLLASFGGPATVDSRGISALFHTFLGR